MKLTDPNFKWTPSWNTNISITFAKYGWIPPSKSKAMMEKVMRIIDFEKPNERAK